MSKLHVYIVHESSSNVSSLNDEPYHRILGCYSDRELAEQHRLKNCKNTKLWGTYTAVTKHSVRGNYIKIGNLVLL